MHSSSTSKPSSLSLLHLLTTDIAAPMANCNRSRYTHRSRHICIIILLSPRSFHGIEEQVHCGWGFWISADVSCSPCRCALPQSEHSASLLKQINRVVPVSIIRLISFPRHNLFSDPAFTLTYFYIWTQTTLYISLMTSIIPCLKPFVAGLNTEYGAFDTEHVSTQLYGGYGSDEYAQGNVRTKHSPSLPSKIASYLAKGPDNLNGDGIVKRQATVNRGAWTPSLGHHGRPNKVMARLREKESDLNPSLAGQNEGCREWKATTQTWAVAQDGNSIKSNDSQQMIIRKDVALQQPGQIGQCLLVRDKRLRQSTSR